MRVIHDDLITHMQCMELIAIHRGLSVVGYRPGVRSATLHDVATIAPQLLVPLVGPL